MATAFVIRKKRDGVITKYFIWHKGSKYPTDGPYYTKKEAQVHLKSYNKLLQRNPVQVLSSTDHDWIPVHAIRKTAEGNIEVMVEKGTLANPGKKKKIINKVKRLFSRR
jgi:hypothetical protein